LEEEEEQVGAPKTSFQVSHYPKMFLNYVALMSSIFDAKLSSYEGEIDEQV
jgi:hypothetical protein